MEGALFTTFLHPASSVGATDFADRFHADYGAAPNYLAAFGYDALVLVAGALRAGAGSREQIRRWLVEEARQSMLPLATPFAGFSAEGEPLALPLVLQLVGGRFERFREPQ